MQQIGYRRYVPQHSKKVVYEKPTTNIKPNCERLKNCLLKSGTRPDFKPLQFNMVLEVLARAIR